ncbi:unnamed protein product [Phaedon cochleariae]|uniref:Uncharacterized protein n=1 Tax=Phaedon cochleariae TaxID=80249 RepID=A0A9P0DKR6_PHACE|nr:unnamed protein product [Phaedon cochleariae]
MNVNLVNRNFQNHCIFYKVFKTVLNQNLNTCRCLAVPVEEPRRYFCPSTRTKFVNSFAARLKRCYSTDKPAPPSNKLPPLSPDFRIVWPSLIKSIKNFILTTFIIKPYLDRDFNLSDFVSGSKRAVEVVSNKLSQGDYGSLEGLVTKDIIPTLQKTISLMSLGQREQLAINVEDIYFSFPYQVGIIFDDEENKDQKRFVEITMVYHSLKGLSTMRSRGDDPPLNMGMMPEYQKNISISNYRFIREFTKGVEGDWTVNLMNHFRPIDEETQE